MTNPSDAVSPGLDRAAALLARTDVAWALICVLTALAYRTSPGFGLVGDAVFLISENPYMRDPSMAWEMVSRDYFWAAADEVIGYWRPWTKLSWWLETQLGGGATWVYHAVSVAWLALLGTGVRALGIRLGLPAGWALLAGAMTVVHPAAIEPTALIMARSDVVCAAAVVWAQVAMVAGFRKPGFGPSLGLAAAAVLAFASKEAAIVMVPLLALHGAALVAQGQAPSRAAWVAHGTVLGALTIGWWVARSAVVGEGAAGDSGLNVLRIVTGLGQYALGALPWIFDPGIRNLSPEEAGSTAMLLRNGVATAGILGLGVALAARRQWGALVVWCWWGGALAPVLLQEQMRIPGGAGVFALSDRWVLQSMAATMLGVAAGLRLVPTLPFRRGLVALSVLWMAATVAIAPVQRAPYRDGLTLLELEDDDYLATPDAYRTPRAHCDFARRTLARATAAGDVDASMAAWNTYTTEHSCTPAADELLNLAVVLVRAQRFAEARPLAIALLEHLNMGRDYYRYHHIIGTVFVETGDPARAVPHLHEALQGGIDACTLAPTLARALVGAERWRPAAEWTLQAGQCQFGRPEPSVQLFAADLYVQGGALTEARALLDSVPPSDLSPELQAVHAELTQRLATEGSAD